MTPEQILKALLTRYDRADYRIKDGTLKPLEEIKDTQGNVMSAGGVTFEITHKARFNFEIRHQPHDAFTIHVSKPHGVGSMTRISTTVTLKHLAIETKRIADELMSEE